VAAPLFSFGFTFSLPLHSRPVFFGLLLFLFLFLSLSARVLVALTVAPHFGLARNPLCCPQIHTSLHLPFFICLFRSEI
jgi:hypothetical protein